MGGQRRGTTATETSGANGAGYVDAGHGHQVRVVLGGQWSGTGRAGGQCPRWW